MTDSQYHLSLSGFSDEEWEIFESAGILFFAEALDEHINDERDPAISTAPTTFSPNCPNCTIASPSSARPAAGATISGTPTAPELLLQLKIGFWVTDLPEAKRRRPASQEDLLCLLPHLAYPDRAREGGFGEVAIRLRLGTPRSSPMASRRALPLLTLLRARREIRRPLN